jgi:acyl-coenzyme A synthetase/AMP-(fatty) acid ligase
VPGDIEEIVDSIPGIRYSAAVGVESERAGTQRLHVVAEVRGDGLAPADLADLARAITREVHRRRGFHPARILLVRAQTIPKTSSGKIQRAALAAQVAAGGLGERLIHHTGAAG